MPRLADGLPSSGVFAASNPESGDSAPASRHTAAPLFSTPVESPPELLAQLRSWAHAGRGGVPLHAAAGVTSGSAPAWPTRVSVDATSSATGSGLASPALQHRAVQTLIAANNNGGSLPWRAHAPPERGTDGTGARAPLPPSFAGDAERVAHGHKRLLGEASPLSFGCTACGACCRSFADTVLCDPADLWRLSMAPRWDPHRAQQEGDGASHGDGWVDPIAARPSAFKPQLGHFTTAALPLGISLPGMLRRHTGIGAAVVSAAGSGPNDGVPMEAGNAQEAARFMRLVEARCADAGLPLTDAAALSAAKRTEGTSAASSVPTLEGIVPVVFLRSRPAGAADEEVEEGAGGQGKARRRGSHREGERRPPVSGGRSRRGAAQGSLSYTLGWKRGRGPWDAHLQCAFAVPHPHTPRAEGGGVTPVTAGSPSGVGAPAASSSSPTPAAFDAAAAGPAAATTTMTGLSCSLGPAYMPTSCALYPLGDMWSSPEPVPGDAHAITVRSQVRSAARPALGASLETGPATDSAARPTDRVHFYSLDHRRCEGVVEAPVNRTGLPLQGGVEASTDAAKAQPPSSVPTGSVGSYRRRNDLDARRAGGDWFMALATAVAALSPDQALATAGERLAAALVEGAHEARAVQTNTEVGGAACGTDDIVRPALPSMLSRMLSSLEPSQAAADATASKTGGRRPRSRGREGAAPQAPSSTTDGSTQSGGLGNALAAGIQQRMRGVLYHQRGLLPDPCSDCTANPTFPRWNEAQRAGIDTRASTVLSQVQVGLWASRQRRIESSLVALVVFACEAAQRMHAAAGEVEQWVVRSRQSRMQAFRNAAAQAVPTSATVIGSSSGFTHGPRLDAPAPSTRGASRGRLSPSTTGGIRAVGTSEPPAFPSAAAQRAWLVSAARSADELVRGEVRHLAAVGAPSG